MGVRLSVEPSNRVKPYNSDSVRKALSQTIDVIEQRAAAGQYLSREERALALRLVRLIDITAIDDDEEQGSARADGGDLPTKKQSSSSGSPIAVPGSPTAHEVTDARKISQPPTAIPPRTPAFNTQRTVAKAIEEGREQFHSESMEDLLCESEVKRPSQTRRLPPLPLDTNRRSLEAHVRVSSTISGSNNQSPVPLTAASVSQLNLSVISTSLGGLRDDDDNVSVCSVVSPRDMARMQSITMLVSKSPAVLAEVARNDTMYRELVQHLRSADSVLELTSELAQSSTEMITLTHLISDKVEKLLDCEQCRLLIVEGDSLIYFGQSGRYDLPQSVGIEGWVYRTKEFLCSTDPYTDARWNDRIDHVAGVKTQSLMCLPLRLNNKCIAVVQAVNKRQHRAFSESDQAVFHGFSTFAGVCIGNAQLFQAQTREKEVSRMLLQISRDLASANLDKDLICHHIIEQSRKLLGADRCSLFLVDEPNAELVVRFDSDGPEVRMPRSAGIAGSVATSGIPLSIADAYADSRFNPAIDKQTGYRTRSILCMPISYEGNIVAVAQLVNKKNGQSFSEEDQHLFTAFAATAGVSLRNAMLYETILKETKITESLLQVSQQLNATDMSNSNAVVEGIMQTARRLMHADRCALFLVDAAENQLSARFGPDQPEIRMPINQGIAGSVATSGVGVNIPDAYRDSRFNPEIDRRTGYRTQSILCMPVKYNSSVVAVAQLLNKEGGSFNRDDEELFVAFSQFAGISLHNSMLYNAQVKASKQLQLLLEQVNELSTIDMGNASEVVDKVLDGARDLVNCERCCFFVVDRENNELEVKGVGVNEGYNGERYPLGQGIIGSVVETGEAVRRGNAAADALYDADIDSCGGPAPTTFMAIPAKYERNVVGVVVLVNKPMKGMFTANDQELLAAYSTFAGVCLYNARMYSFVLAANEQALDLHNRANNARSTRNMKKLKIEDSTLQYYKDMKLADEERTMLTSPEFPIHTYGPTTPNMGRLVPMVAVMFEHFQLFDKFTINRDTLFRLVIGVKDKYRPVPYHNFAHAFDVMQTLFLFLTLIDLDRYFVEQDVLMLLLCGLFHDVDHMGLNNSFLFQAETPLGLLSTKSGARSALEVHHCHLAVEFLSNESANVLSGLPEARMKEAWRMLIDAILATDMALHKDVVADFRRMCEGGYDKGCEDHRILLAKMLLKCADISNICKPFLISRQWGVMITQEFYKADLTKAAECKIVEPELAANQIGFITGVGKDLFGTLVRFLPELHFLTDNLESNLSRWQAIVQQAKEAAAAASAAATSTETAAPAPQQAALVPQQDGTASKPLTPQPMRMVAPLPPLPNHSGGSTPEASPPPSPSQKGKKRGKRWQTVRVTDADIDEL